MAKYGEDEQRRLRGEHLKSYSQDKPLGHGANLQALIRGIKQWLPDITASVGDIADLAYEGGARALTGKKIVQPLGAGPAIRRFIQKPAPRAQTEISATPELDPWEEVPRFLNPLLLNPKEAARLGALSLLGVATHGANLGVVKPRGGNWFTGPGSEMENALHYLRKGAERPTPEQAAINQWIEGPLARYIKRDMATESDPIRKLLEQDRPVSHLPLNELLSNGTEGWVPNKAIKNRRAEGFPEVGSGQGGYGQAWENTADAMISNNPADEVYKLTKEFNPNGAMAADWVKNLPPESKIYDFAGDEAPDWLGFTHLTDELWNAARPDSDLPAHLRLSPEQFKQLGIEKAVRHVADINAYRAGKKAESAIEMLTGPGVKPVREYTENNPKGLRWVELNRSEDLLSPDDFEAEMAKKGLSPKEWDQAMAEYRAKRLSDPDVQKQLKYEGDTMGHCVGGYCEDVLEGNSRIFSLRDAKGEPHVTIETSPSGELHNLVQVKGKQNQRPKEEYIPFVQDFIKNSPIGGWHGFDEYPENMGLTVEELQSLLPKPKDYAQGGLVGRQDFNGAVGYIL